MELFLRYSFSGHRKSEDTTHYERYEKVSANELPEILEEPVVKSSCSLQEQNSRELIL